MSRKMTKGIDYTSKDYLAFKQLLIQKLVEKMPEYTDTSETDAGIVILEAFANGLDILSLYQDTIANDVILMTTQDRKLAVILAKTIGYTPYNQTSCIQKQVFVLEGVLYEDYLIPRGTVVKTVEKDGVASIYYQTTEDHVIPAGNLGNEQSDNEYLYTVPVRQGISVKDDIIGTSSGAPLQTFTLNYPKALLDSIEIYVDEGYGPALWTQVDSFIDADENSQVYVASLDDFDVCTIEFGNGLKGKIPVSYANGISANYLVGGGEAGNVAPNKIVEIDTQIVYVASTFNVEIITRGHDKESLESIKENAPGVARTRHRLVTLEDYKDLIRAYFYPFIQIKAVNDEDDKKFVHIYYMLRSNYTLTQDLQDEIAEFISARAMIGTSYDLIAYTPEVVNIVAVLYVDDHYDVTEVKTQVESYLTSVTFAYGNLQFDDSIIKSDVESEVRDTFDGVISFRINTPSGAIISPSAVNKVLTLGTLTITAQHL